ncbi:MAG: EscU/YscU/HrcU family type III secretion system export apparatus switch protein [Desulforegulaceae bacterium]|nr:EscU/YscU/HrcU family type III secretion system export apparatus switch protein [Desulforegulaceae bacterium]
MTISRKIKKAVALKYDKSKGLAPKVKAKGKGVSAEKIIETAKAHNVPIAEDPDLAEVLSKLELEEEIPPDLYKAVAELLAYVYSRNKNL